MKTRKIYTVETNNSYNRFDFLAQARDLFKSFKVMGTPVELYSVDEYGLCHTISKHGRFTWEH